MAKILKKCQKYEKMVKLLKKMAIQISHNLPVISRELPYVG